ncbi:class I SAM-dependent methyltransferase [bacterium]|nr:class I SAM-dependent methyltransferase [bacterium]
MLQDWFRVARPVEPYSQLAHIYDYAMRHVNYGRWAAYLCKLFSKADFPVRKVLDIACGTGNLLVRFADSGFRLAGVDSSESMIRIAKKKVYKENLIMPLWCGSMQDFQVSTKFDALVCIYDSINYCMDSSAYQATIRHAAQALRCGGLFIFDICTQKNSRTNFQDYYERDGADDYQYIRQSFYSRDSNIQTNEFVITRNSGSTSVFKEQHKQRIYKIQELRNALPPGLFEIVGIYDGFSMRSGSERSDRVHFVLKKV